MLCRRYWGQANVGFWNPIILKFCTALIFTWVPVILWPLASVYCPQAWPSCVIMFSFHMHHHCWWFRSIILEHRWQCITTLKDSKENSQLLSRLTLQLSSKCASSGSLSTVVWHMMNECLQETDWVRKMILVTMLGKYDSSKLPPISLLAWRRPGWDLSLSNIQYKQDENHLPYPFSPLSPLR